MGIEEERRSHSNLSSLDFVLYIFLPTSTHYETSLHFLNFGPPLSFQLNIMVGTHHAPSVNL